MSTVDTRLSDLVAAHTGERFEATPMATDGNVLRSATMMVYLAVDHRAAARLPLEARRLAWARRAGVPVPEVLELDARGRWLLVSRAPDDDRYGADYVDAALAAGCFPGASHRTLA